MDSVYEGTTDGEGGAGDACSCQCLCSACLCGPVEGSSAAAHENLKNAGMETARSNGEAWDKCGCGCLCIPTETTVSNRNQLSSQTAES